MPSVLMSSSISAQWIPYPRPTIFQSVVLIRPAQLIVTCVIGALKPRFQASATVAESPTKQKGLAGGALALWEFQAGLSTCLKHSFLVL